MSGTASSIIQTVSDTIMQSNVISPSQPVAFFTSDNIAAISNGGNLLVFLGGSGDSFSGANGSNQLIVTSNTAVFTNSDTSDSEGLAGSGNEVSLGSPTSLVWDASAGGNDIIPHPGDTVLVGGPGAANDVFDLRSVLAGGGSLSIATFNGDVIASVSTGPNGAAKPFAVIENESAAAFLAHSVM